jgi:NAD(P)-dependent dehydrogenase (short-subunit alcohol dehydrogenase family)
MESLMKQTDLTPVKTAFLTGATSGIGLAAAEELAARGWLVLGVGRSAANCRQAEQDIRRYYPEARLAYFIADLSAQREVNRLADQVGQYLEQNCSGRLDVLINNAGTVQNCFMATADGYETQFAVNHLAGFLLASRMLDYLRKSPAGRILTVSSNSHRGARIHWADVMLQKHYSLLAAYKQSKLCNVLFTHEFNRREDRAQNPSPVRAFTVDPGLVNTAIGSKGTRGLAAWFWQLRRRHGLSPFQAACTIIHLCKMPPGWQPAGSYFRNCAPLAPSRLSQDPGSGSRLWQLSARLCGIAGGTEGQGSGVSQPRL